MKHCYLNMIIFFKCLACFTLNGQVSELSVSLHPDSVLIGQPANLSIRIVKDNTIKVNFPTFGDTLISGIEILNKSGIDTSLHDKNIILTQQLLITGFDSGYFHIPPLGFPVEINGVQNTIHSVPVYLRIDLPEIDPQADFRDIKPALNTPVNLREALPYIAGGSLLIALILATIWLIRRYRGKRQETAEPLPDVPPYIIALQELQRLRMEKAWETQSIKEYYTQLSGIIRTYLENQFAIQALELTTQEILSDFEFKFGKNPALKHKLTEMLQLSDLVKFAKEAPSVAMNLENLDKAIAFIELTKPDSILPEEKTTLSGMPENDK